MPAERFYVDQDLKEQETALIEQEEFHHLAHVCRIKAKEIISLVNGKGALAEGFVEDVAKHRATVTIISSEQKPPPLYELILAQGLPRQPRLEYILEKTVELGVTKLWLFPGSLSEKKEMSPSQMQRAHHILIAAMKQCGRLFLPELLFIPPILSWDKDNLPSSSFFGDTSEQAPSFLRVLSKQSDRSILIAIGPEKGFDSKEESHMKYNLGLLGVHLHENILRTDTAAIASVALASSFLQNLSSP